MRVFLVVHGAVQDVGYRHLVRTAALRSGIRGFVRNVEDGSVEALAEGSPMDLQRFEKEIDVSVERGPQVFRIDRIIEEDKEFPSETYDAGKFVIEETKKA